MVIYTGSPRLLVSTGNILGVIFQRAKKDALDEMEATDKNCRDLTLHKITTASW